MTKCTIPLILHSLFELWFDSWSLQHFVQQKRVDSRFVTKSVSHKMGLDLQNLVCIHGWNIMLSPVNVI